MRKMRLSRRLRAGEVKVRVRACALNHLDIWVRNGIPAYKTPLPHILGSDIAGEVVEVGEGVRNWGQRRRGDSLPRPLLRQVPISARWDARTCAWRCR
jgi:NADPH:quinone reductase-like Zn-dependent oxidoreductase